MKIRRIGPAVEIPDLKLVVPPQVVIDVPKKVAEALLAQGGWERVEEKKRKKNIRGGR